MSVGNVFLTILDKTNVITIVLCACACLYTRSAGVLYFCTGAVGCSLSVKLVKRVLKQPRPEVTKQPGRRKKKSYGMPSTHSASIAYIGTVVALGCARLPTHPSFPAWVAKYAWVPALGWTGVVSISRIWLGHHTKKQVAVGCLYGVGFALCWFSLWTRSLQMYGHALEARVPQALRWAK
ncbi:PAP2-domain-containing protein [Pterulicium gracile]|uniref:PAP2-domain-containing protein n=1 Tax=Pterulicium gracile TaxID=1884261 RepID=A0A5C3QZC9_9AGAR|nr:PAP2-domain-containing protein [Pterula gracilis]